MTQTIETEQETPLEKEYRELSVRLTLVGVRVEEAEQVLRTHVFANPRLTAVSGAIVMHSDGERDRLEAELRRLYLERQSLLPRWSELKFELGLAR